MKLKKFILTIVFLFAFLLLCNTCVYAGDLELRNLNYDVTLNADGTATITAGWGVGLTIYIEYTIDGVPVHKLYKTRYSIIMDV